MCVEVVAARGAGRRARRVGGRKGRVGDAVLRLGLRLDGGRHGWSW